MSQNKIQKYSTPNKVKSTNLHYHSSNQKLLGAQERRKMLLMMSRRNQSIETNPEMTGKRISRENIK